MHADSRSRFGDIFWLAILLAIIVVFYATLWHFFGFVRGFILPVFGFSASAIAVLVIFSRNR